MRCAKAQRLISDHIDKLLNGRQIQALEQHLKECAACTELLNEMQMITGEAKNMKSVLPSENLWAAIKSEILKNEYSRILINVFVNIRFLEFKRL